MTRRWTTNRALALLVALMLLLAACSQGGGVQTTEGQDDSANEQPPALEPAPEPVEEETPGYPAPLTGLKVEEEPTARPVAVMVNNFKAARPQSGLPHADMVWEVLAEGGITRLIAIFQSDPYTGLVGPIRSIRPYLIELAESYQAIIAHAGGSPDAYAILQKQHKPYLDEITNAGAYFERSKERKAPHNLYSDLTRLREGADKKGYKTDVAIPAFRFMDEPAPPAGGTDAANIDITFLMKSYKVSYAYDPDSGLYARSIDGEPHTDLVSGEQLTAANVVVLSASHKVLDNEGRLAINLESGGEAMLFQLGKAVTCEWERGSDGMIRIVKDGAELSFSPGKTWYHIVPSDSPLADHVAYAAAGAADGNTDSVTEG